MINGRSLIQRNKLRILIDAEAFNHLLSKGDVSAKLLLEYSIHDLVEFIRTPISTAHKELQNIPAFSEKYDENGRLSALELINDDYQTTITFGYLMEDIEQIGKHILEKETLNSAEKQQILLIFIQAVLNRNDSAIIFITDKKLLLKNRLRFESTFPGTPLNIVTLEEAKEIVDLFLKFHNQYHILANFTCNKGYYYLLSFRSKIPHIHFGDSILDAFAVRFKYLLTSVDEIGIQYFLGVNNDTMDNTMYHFNYFVTLVTGIFDNLATRTNAQYDLGFEGTPQRISLNPKAGKDLLKALSEKHRELQKHIEKHVCLIKLIYEFREVIVHRDLLHQLGFESMKANEKWKMNFIWVDQKIVNLIRQCQDKPQEYELVTKWGVYASNSNHILLEPFRFAKSVTRNLIKFSDEYLRLLGFINFPEEMRDSDAHKGFVNEMELFKVGNLGL